MNNFSSRKMPNALYKVFSVFAIAAVIIGGLGPIFTPEAKAEHVVDGNGAVNVYAVPGSGTLTAGQSMEIHMTVTVDPADTNPLTSPSCLVNGVQVASTFQNLTSGADGHFKFTYTVGASDTDRAAGEIPIDCALQQTHGVTVTMFDDSNTVAIDAVVDGGGGPTATVPSFSSIQVAPNTGTISEGMGLTINFNETSDQTDITVTGTCKINGVDSGSTWSHVGGGNYTLDYVVSPGDGERPAGNIPFTCTLGNSAGNTTINGWSDSNTLAIDTNGDGSIDNGTSTLGFTVVANPGSGTLHVGDQVVVSMQDPLPSGDVVIGSAGCRVNDVDVSGSYGYHGNGLYKVTYTVGAGNANRAAGQIPFDCTLQNNTGSVHLVEFTDGNTLAVDTTVTGGDTGTTTESGSIDFSVTTVSGSNMVHAGQQIEVYLEETSGNPKIELNGACRVNDVDVSGTFANLTGGLYKVIYTVGESDAEREVNQLPISCALRDYETGATTTVTAFTNGTANVPAVDTNNDGTITAPTGDTVAFLSTVSASPSSGTLNTGGQLLVSMQEGNNDAGFTVQSCTVNNVNVASSFQDAGNGLYRVTYTVGAGDANRAAGQIPLNCVLRDTIGQTVTASAFTDSNTVAISITSGDTGTTTGTTTDGTIGGDVTGGDAASSGFLQVTSIDQIRDTAVAGAGYDQGWVWVFNVTIPDDETSLQMKFDNWSQTDGSDTINMANNMRISSNQAQSTSTMTMTSAGQYGATMNITGDLNATTPGRQIQIRVEMQVPSGTTNGSYTTNYGIKTM